MAVKIIKYKGVTVNKPDNISLTTIKRIVDELGKDNCITVDSIVQFLSEYQKRFEKEMQS